MNRYEICGHQPNEDMKAHLVRVSLIIAEIKVTVQGFAEKYRMLNFEFLLDSINISSSEVRTSWDLKSKLEDSDTE